MIELMEMVALILGTLFSFYYFRSSADNILILIYFSVFSSKERFSHLYDQADDEVTFSFIGTQLDDVKIYSDYFRLHEAARPTSFKHFQRYYKSLISLLLKHYLPIVLAPTILFWSNWYFYLIGVLLTLIGLVVYKTFIKGYRIGFYQRLVVFAVIKDYQKTSREKHQKQADR